MSFAKSIPQTLKELRVHIQFVLASYPQLKASNPDLKVLIREARGVEPRVFARFEHGREAQTSVTDLSKEEVEKKVGDLVSRG